MRVLTAVLLICFALSATAQNNYNGFTSDFRNYDGLPPSCYTPTVNNLNGHLAGINNRLCQLLVTLDQISGENALLDTIQMEIEALLESIFVLDVTSADSSIQVALSDNTFDLSYVWAFNGDTLGCSPQTIVATYPSSFDYIDTFGLNQYFIYANNEDVILFFEPTIIYGQITPQALIDTIIANFIVSDSFSIAKISDTSFSITIENPCIFDRLVIGSTTDGNDYSVEVWISGNGVVVNNETLPEGGFGSLIEFNVNQCNPNTSILDSTLQYLINYYCSLIPPTDTCCSGAELTAELQAITGLAILDLSASFPDTNCITVTRHLAIFDGDTIATSSLPTVQFIEAGAWTAGDTIFTSSCVFVATKLNIPCDTVCLDTFVVVLSDAPPTVAVQDNAVIQRNACDTIAVTNNDVKPCGVASIAVLDTTSGIASATVYNDSLIIICRNNTAFSNDTVYYSLTSNCGVPDSDTSFILVTANLVPQVPFSVCYEGVDADADSARLTYSVTVPSGYSIPTNGLLFKASDGTLEGYRYGTGGVASVPYGTTANLDSADITVYLVLTNNITGLPLFYQFNVGYVLDGDCDTMLLDTVGTTDYYFASTVQFCFNYIGYQSGGTSFGINSGTLYRYRVNQFGIASNFGLDSIFFQVDEVNLPCSNDSTYQYAIKNVPPYTIVDIDGNPVSITSGLSVGFTSSTITANAGTAISIVSSIGLCSVLEFTTNWGFRWAAINPTYTFSFDGISFTGQCVNFTGIILPL